MTTLHVVDADTGDIVQIDTENLSGALHVIDADTGNIVELDLGNLTGTLTVVDANTGEIVPINLETPTGILYVNDPNTGEIVEVDYDNRTGSYYVVDANTGDFVLISFTDGGGETTYHLNFDGVDDHISVLASSSINNLPANDFTVEFVLNVDSINTAIINKVDSNYSDGWDIYADEISGTLEWVITANNQDDYFQANIPLPNNLVHHYELAWDASAKEMLFFIDGVQQSETVDWDVYASYNSDAASDMGIGYYEHYDAGAEWFYSNQINWLRISNTIRHTSNFSSPSLTVCPDADANTVLLLAIDDGSGAVVEDTSGNNNDGAIIGGATWEED